jgi:hypothetical protein
MFSTRIVEPFRKAQETGVIPPGIESMAGGWGEITEDGNISWMNVIFMHGYDVTNVRDLTRAEMEGRQRAIWAMEALRMYCPGFENAHLNTYSASLGTRESRKVIGRSNLTEYDVKNQARFPDSIGIYPEFIDTKDVLYLPTTGRYFQVPYGIMVPGKVENLLVAGRCVGGDSVSHGATREMSCCSLTGQAAGIASAVSIKNNVGTSEIPIDRLQKAIKDQGVRID